MSKIVYIYKRKSTDAAWSTTISELGSYLENEHNEFNILYLDNSSLKHIFDSKKKLNEFNLEKNDILIINHAICFWLLISDVIRLKRIGVKIIFLFHEHEHILGLKYCLKHIKNIKVKEWLRHLKLWYKIPVKMATHTVCLSFPQITVLNEKNCERISFLGIEPSQFPKKENTKNYSEKTSPIVMFPHDPKRFDKGNRFFIELMKNKEFKFIYGRDIILPYNEVYKKYHNADIIFLPSDSESYSLVLAEALATNSCVITNSNIGIIQLLLSIFTISELEEYGLFICLHSDYDTGLKKANNFLNMKETNTIELFKILNLDKKSANKRFLTFIHTIENSDV